MTFFNKRFLFSTVLSLSLLTIFDLHASLKHEELSEISAVSKKSHSFLSDKELMVFKQHLEFFKERRSLSPHLSQLAEDQPRCFISYAWGIPEHENLIHTLAADLKDAGINVFLDIWHNTAGTGIAQFAELILDERTDFVVLAGSRKLMEKYTGNAPSVVKLELGMIAKRATGPIHTILPILLEDSHEKVLPKFLWNTVSADFKNINTYPISCFNLLGQLYRLATNDPLLVRAREEFSFNNKTGSSVSPSSMDSKLLLNSSEEVHPFLTAKHQENILAPDGSKLNIFTNTIYKIINCGNYLDNWEGKDKENSENQYDKGRIHLNSINLPSTSVDASRQLWCIEPSIEKGKYKISNSGNYLDNWGSKDKRFIYISNRANQGRVHLCSSNIPSNNPYYSRQLWSIELSGVKGKYKISNDGNYLENWGGSDRDMLSISNDQGRVNLCSNDNAPNSPHYSNQLWEFELATLNKSSYPQ